MDNITSLRVSPRTQCSQKLSKWGRDSFVRKRAQINKGDKQKGSLNKDTPAINIYPT